MKKNILVFTVLAAAMLMGAACTKTLEMDYDEIEPMLVVQGNVSTDGMLVYLRHHSNMADTMNKEGVPGALVTIAGSDGFEETLEYGDGRYYSPSNAKGVPGVTYTLRVECEGKVCHAQSTMPAPVDIDSVRWDWMPIINDVSIRIAKVFLTDDPSTTDYYYLEMTRDGKVMKTGVSSDGGLSEAYNYFNWGMTSKNNQETEEEELKKTGKRKGDVLYAGDRLTISLRTLDWSAFHYFATVEENGKGVNPESNLQGEGCLGYFSAYGVSHANVVFPSVNE